MHDTSSAGIHKAPLIMRDYSAMLSYYKNSLFAALKIRSS